jgi:hypothetical protein
MLLVVFNFKFRPGVDKVQIFGHQCGVSDSSSLLCVRLVTVVVQVLEKRFPDIDDAILYMGADLKMACLRTRLRFTSNCQMHSCEGCQDGFSAKTPKGLKLHQKICRSSLKHEAAANERRKSTAAKNAIRRTKLRERKMRSGSAALGVQVRFL